MNTVARKPILCNVLHRLANLHAVLHAALHAALIARAATRGCAVGAMFISFTAAHALGPIDGNEPVEESPESSLLPSLDDLVPHANQELIRQPGTVIAREGFLNLRTGDVRVADEVDLLEATGARALANGDKNTNPAIAWPANANQGLRAKPLVLILNATLTPTDHATLQALGIRRMGYLPSNAYIVDVSPLDLNKLADLSKLGFVASLIEYRDQWKLDPWLLRGANARNWKSTSRQGLATPHGTDHARVAAIVHGFANVTLTKLRQEIETIPGVDVFSNELVMENWTLSITLPDRAAAQLATLPGVQFAEMTPEYARRSNSTTRWVVQSNISGVFPLHARGLFGQGQIMGFMDFGMAWQHCSFLDAANPIGPNHRKIAAYNAPLTYDQHGTHVAATAMGDAGNSGNTRGIAYLARIVFDTVPDVVEASHLSRYTLHASQGAVIHSNSWGADFFTEYDGGARAIDAMSWTNDTALICFSVSNQSILGNPENAKNALAVSLTANAPNQNSMPCGGASGPTADGRRKPDLLAPGCSITSASGSSSTSCGQTTRTGTSMAQPAVAAIAILTREYFLDGFYPSGAAHPSDSFEPSGSLLKAVLIASGQDISETPGYPNMREGWGRVLADAALYLNGDSSKLLVRQAFNNAPNAIEQGSVIEVPFTVDSSPETLRISLAWHDFPATLGATFTPVNNLDIFVIAPDGSLYQGNNFTPQGLSRPLVAGTTQADTINNTEQVIVANPAVGNWLVRIVGTSINEPKQGYGLAIIGDVDEVSSSLCVGDFNRDGGVTGDDVIAFFVAFEAGAPEADIDESGGIEGGDIAAFFTGFEAGC